MFGRNFIPDSEEPIINRLHGDKVIWIIIFLLSLISIALIYSSSSSLAFKEHTTNFSFLLKQMKFVLLGLAALYICYRIPLGWYRTLAYPVFGLSLVLLLMLPFFGQEINGAKRWLNLGFSFQPAEVAKIAVILYLARALELYRLDTYKDFLIRIVAPIGAVCVLIMLGSVSTALFVGLLSFGILFVAGISWNYLLKTAAIGAGVLTLLVLLHLAFGIFPRLDTATSRLEKFFTKTEVNQEEMTAEQKQKIADKTFQADMAKIAISSVGILGKGPGKSTQRYVLPHPYSDYIYTIIIEEYGLVGGVFVLMLYLWFLYRCIILVKNCSRTFTAITVGGLGLLISIQATLHILVNVGIMPVTGHTLPLVSLGGTSLVILSCAFGIILSVSRTIDIDAAKREEQERKRREEEERRAAEERAAEEKRLQENENSGGEPEERQ